ncbi:MAG: PKD domain-containing protein, partial [Bacteroidota bacterium]|nr:PKD domain-containing protein [Bacteroidota bacterium]
CVLTKSFTINQPNQLGVFISTSSNVSCKGGNDGTATASVSGGTPFYNYNWLPMGGNGPTGTGLSAGTYTVNVTDNNSCASSVAILITEPSQVLTSVTSQNNVSCFGGNNGTATVTASGGTLSYTYLWSNGQTSSSIGVLTAGNYAVTTTDAKGCIVTTSLSITQPAMALASTTTQNNVSCYGGSNGSASVIATGGTPPYTYLWSNGQTTTSITGLITGNYTVTVTDFKGCTTTASVSITQPVAPLTSSSSQTNVSCFGESNGSASVIPTGGTSPYTYVWNNGQTTGTATGLIAGNYSVTTTDSKSCTTVISITITEPALLSSNVSQTNVSCYGGNNGSALVSTPSGGTSPYTYLWSNGQISSSITELIVGTYSLTVTDAKGCTIAASATITQPIAPLSFTTSQTNVSCFGGNNGSASVIAADGTPAYSYLWMPGSQTTSSISNLTIGTYTITVTDANGCNTTGFITITQPAVLAVNFINQTNVSCFAGNNGSVTASASGGIQNYTYLWMPGNVTTSAISNIPIGTYTVTVTDNLSCQVQNNVTITQPVAALSVSVSSTPTSCYGGTDGSVASVISGGTSLYTYNWLPGNHTTQNVSGLSAGNYTVTVTDSKGCIISNSVIINQPVQIVLVPGTVNSTCTLPNGTAYVSVSGGVGSYAYQWSPSGGNNDTATGLFSAAYTVLVTDGNGCSISQSLNVNDNNSPTVTIISKTDVTCNGGSTGTASAGISGGSGPFTYNWAPYGGNTSNATGLLAGTYTLTVTDDNGCQSLATTSPAITEPVALVLTVTTADVSCFGGSNGTASVSASGGTPGYTYTWLPSGSVGTSINNLSAGTYTVQVTDINNCVLTKSFTINQPNQLGVFISTSSNVSCKGGNDGTATASVSGGTPFYNYTWLPMGGNGPIGTGLSAGTYTVNVTDNNSCASSVAILITEPSQALTSVTSQNNVSCFGGNNGTATVTASGGTLSYTYLWSNGQTSSSIGVLTAGNYSVTTTDAKGCIATTSISIIQPAMALASTTTQNNVSCYGGSNGLASVIATGGTPPYTYLWSNGPTSSSATGLITGNYAVTVTDFKGCTTTASVSISQPTAPLTSSTSQINVSCFGESNGSASAIPAGGTLPYTYLWSNGQTAVTATGLIAGNYSITTTDTNGCTIIANLSISEPAILTATATQTNICTGTSNGLAAVSVSGGTSPFSYLWSDGQTSSSATGLSVGNYSVTTTDVNGCTTMASVAITLFPAIFSTTSQTNVLCYGDNNGSASIIPSGGTSPFTYLWNNGQSTSSLTGLTAPMTIGVTVSDANGCTTTASFSISQPAAALSAVPSQTNVSCFGGNNGSASVTASGGTASYTYQWNTGQTQFQISNLISQTYTVIVTDTNGCMATTSVSITQPPTPISSITSQSNLSCFGDSNGSASVVASGGISPYTYLWSNGQTSSSVTGLTSGSYSITTTDVNGCIIVDVISITEPSVLFTTAVQTNICTGATNGLTTVSASGGTIPYSYLWNNGQTNSSATGLSAGNYSVTTTDANGCTATSVGTITQFPAIFSTTSQTNVSCNGGNNGYASVIPSGGTTPFTYQWNNGLSNSSITALVAGNYTATVTDANGCTATASALIIEPSPLIVSIGSIVNTTCFNGTNGSAAATATGGVSPYLFNWSTVPAQTNSGATDLGAGTYTATVTDSNGCINTSTVTIAQPSQVITMAGANDSICLGQSGVVTATASGGGGGYSYTWLPSNITNSGTLTITPSSSVTYTVTAQDQYGCAGVGDSVAGIIYQLNPANVQVTGNSPICPGQSSIISVQATGTTGALTYLWNNNLGTGTGPYTVTPSLPTTYLVTVTNECGSSVTEGVQVLFNPPPTVNLTSDTTQNCVPALIQFYDNSVTGNNTDPISTWYWDFGDGTSSTLQNPIHNYTQAGSYSIVLTVTTSGGCTNNNATTPFIIIGRPIPTAVFSVNSINLDLPQDVLICTNQSVGANVYNWSFGDGNTSNLVHPQNTYITVGIFQIQLIAISQNGCRDTAYSEVTTNVDVVFPNVFTPNPDGPVDDSYDMNNMDNDIFFPYTSGVIEFKLEIFNRWGEEIFESLDVKKGWNGYYKGALCQQDVYVWKAYVKLNNGKVFNKSGDVTLLR